MRGETCGLPTLGAGRDSEASCRGGRERGERGGEGAAVLKNLDVSSPFRLRVKFAKFGGFSSEVLAEEP